MENPSNSPLAPQDQEMLNDIIKLAGLDVKDAKNQQIALEVMKDLEKLQGPEREKERDALMREFGIQPDEFKKTMAEAEAREQSINNREIDLQNKEVGLLDKFKKRGLVRVAIGVLAGIGTGILSYKQWFGAKEKAFPKWGGTIGAGLAGTVVANMIAGLFTTKPVQKEADKLNIEQAELANDIQLQQGAKQYLKDSFYALASRMLKARVEKTAEQQQEPHAHKVEETVKHHAHHVPQHANFTDKVVADKEAAAVQLSSRGGS